MNGDEVRRWAARWGRVDEVCREEVAAQVVEPAVALRQGLSLLATMIDVLGWPLPPDPVREQEDEVVRGAWAKLRAGMR